MKNHLIHKAWIRSTLPEYLVLRILNDHIAAATALSLNGGQFSEREEGELSKCPKLAAIHANTGENWVCFWSASLLISNMTFHFNICFKNVF